MEYTEKHRGIRGIRSLTSVELCVLCASVVKRITEAFIREIRFNWCYCISFSTISFTLSAGILSCCIVSR